MNDEVEPLKAALQMYELCLQLVLALTRRGVVWPYSVLASEQMNSIIG